jgi:hypothetical protein
MAKDLLHDVARKPVGAPNGAEDLSSLPFSLNLTYCIKRTRISGPAGIGAIQASTAKITTRGRSQYRSLGRHPGSKVFRDHGIGGKNGREKLPGFDKLLNAVAGKDVDVVAAWSVDLLGLGVDVFLTKPCLPEDLEGHVRRLLEGKGNR